MSWMSLICGDMSESVLNKFTNSPFKSSHEFGGLECCDLPNYSITKWSLTLNSLQRSPGARSHRGPHHQSQNASESRCSIPWPESPLLSACKSRQTRPTPSAPSPHTEYHLPLHSSPQLLHHAKTQEGKYGGWLKRGYAECGEWGWYQ